MSVSRELIKANASNFETLANLVILSEVTQLQQNTALQQANNHQQTTSNVQSTKITHNLSLLQTAFSVDGTLCSKVYSHTH